MEKEYLTYNKLKQLYPDEWILLGNPEMKNISVLGGTVLYHSKDKKEVCYIGRDKTGNYKTITIVFAGDIKQHRRLGILRHLQLD